MHARFYKFDVLNMLCYVPLADTVVRHGQESMQAHSLEKSHSSIASSDSEVQAISIAAVKYADLSVSRDANYQFSPAKMTALTGNTAVYMLYALRRIRLLTCNIVSELCSHLIATNLWH